MFSRTAARSLVACVSRIPSARLSYSEASGQFWNQVFISQLRNPHPQAVRLLPHWKATSLLYATKSQLPPSVGSSNDEKACKRKLARGPETVSTGSSVRHVPEESQEPKVTSDEMLGAVKSELKIIKDAFSLRDVPNDSLYIGAAGVLPYAATSLSTVYLAWDINHADATGSGYLFSPDKAYEILSLISPIQIGYGAVIISFLSAIHWGMEYSEYGGRHSYRRLIFGVIGPAVAWPTLLMPVEYALISQFIAFNFLYFADARATVRGWFPPWYSIYRFILTSFVGASIVVSLVGRGKIVGPHGQLKSAVEYVKEDRDTQWEALEQKEKKRVQNVAQKKIGPNDETRENYEDSDDSHAGEKNENERLIDGKNDDREKC